VALAWEPRFRLAILLSPERYLGRVILLTFFSLLGFDPY